MPTSDVSQVRATNKCLLAIEFGDDVDKDASGDRLLKSVFLDLIVLQMEAYQSLQMMVRSPSFNIFLDFYLTFSLTIS